MKKNAGLMNNKMVRFRALLTLIAFGILASCTDSSSHLPEKRLMVLGVDGMDFRMTSRLMAEGRMPNFTRLSQQGAFDSLGTSVPPLSPVAWSDFMTGLDSGGHGIFDFLHRDPDKLIPEFSMSRAEPPDRHLSLGSWKLPLNGGQLINLRQGKVFWEQLQDNGITSTIIRMPANYPPVGVGERELSGMGTPDLQGGYGEFSFITTKFGAGRQSIEGGEIQEVWDDNGIIQAKLTGPLNPFKDPAEAVSLEVPLQIIPEPNGRAVQIQVGDSETSLTTGGWSGWVPVEFEMLPILPLSSSNLHGMVRFYLRSVTPNLELYVSPINFDPLHPDTAISAPADFAVDLAEATGRFYTQGMPEETKALEAGILNREEFFEQAKISAEDIMAQLGLMVSDFLAERRSFLFYYLGHLDQVSHMTWKSTDPEHPFYDPETDPYWAAKIEDLYIEIDTFVGQLADQLEGQASLVVMSDHGFAPWRREMDLNAWLLSEGYLVLKNGHSSSGEVFQNVDWSKTRAYGVGFNGLYLNLQDREKAGIVSSQERDALLADIQAKLLAVVDTDTGEQAVTKVYRSDQHYQFDEDRKQAPDLVIGYAYGTRGSSASALGAVGNVNNIFSDHAEQWSGDHSMDHETVPGILLTTSRLTKPAYNLRDISKSILSEFDLEPSP